MRNGGLPDMIEFVLRQTGGATYAADILRRLHELEILDRHWGVDEGRIMDAARAEPSRFDVMIGDAIALAPSQFEDLPEQFRRRVRQLMDAMSGGFEEKVAVIAAVLVHALYVRDAGASPEYWTEGKFKENCLKQTIERLAVRYPGPMAGAVAALHHIPEHRRVEMDQWLSFADLVKPDPIDAVLVMREISRTGAYRGELLPVELSLLMGALLPQQAKEHLLDLTMEAGILPIALPKRNSPYRRVVGLYRDEVNSMYVQMELEMLGQNVESRNTSTFMESEEFDQIIVDYLVIVNHYLQGFEPDVEVLIDSMKRARSLLTRKGFVVALVPAEFLFDQTQGFRALREVFLRDDHLEAVIQVPVGSFKPMAEMETAIIVLNKAKVPERRKKLLLVHLNFEQLSSVSARGYIDDMVECLREWRTMTNRSLVVHTESIERGGSNLLPSRYFTCGASMEMLLMNPEGTMVCLNELTIPHTFEHIRARRSEQLNRRNDPPAFVQVRNLSKDPAHPYLQIDDSEAIRGDVLIVDKDAILVNRQFVKPRPTIYEARGGRIAIPSSVLAFCLDTNKVQPKYLVNEMRKPYYQDQIKAISFGASSPSFTLQALLSTTIVILPAEKQEEALCCLPIEMGADGSITQPTKPAEISIKVKGRKCIECTIEEIVYIGTDKRRGSGSGNKVIYFTDRKPETLVDCSFEKLREFGFQDNQFLQTQKSFLVNVRFIDGSDVKAIPVRFMDDKGEHVEKTLPVSKNYRSAIRKHCK